MLVACAHPAPAMRDERTAVISGRETRGYSPSDAVQKDLVLAAKMTVDHGFRYFRIVSSHVPFGAGGDAAIQPGADVTIRVFHEGETSARVAGIWDAEAILTTGAPAGAVGAITVATPPPPRRPSGAPASHCTAYGCNW